MLLGLPLSEGPGVIFQILPYLTLGLPPLMFCDSFSPKNILSSWNLKGMHSPPLAASSLIKGINQVLTRRRSQSESPLRKCPPPPSFSPIPSSRLSDGPPS